MHSNIPLNNDEILPDRYKPLRVGFYIAIIALVVYLLCLSGCASAYTQEEAIKAIIGESEGEPQQGKEAVACAISNRHSLSGVYGLYAQRVLKHKYTNQTYNNALKAVLKAKNAEYCQELIHGASFWEGTAFKTPYWAKSMRMTAIIGHQRFYRKD